MHATFPITELSSIIASYDKAIETLLLDISLSMTQKDDAMLPLLQQKKVLQQCLNDIQYLIDNPPAKGGPCGISRYRDD